ncbi:MAG: hypothetical protein V9G12_07745 [Microthrixaceae bacterium]
MADSPIAERINTFGPLRCPSAKGVRAAWKIIDLFGDYTVGADPETLAAQHGVTVTELEQLLDVLHDRICPAGIRQAMRNELADIRGQVDFIERSIKHGRLGARDGAELTAALEQLSQRLVRTRTWWNRRFAERRFVFDPVVACGATVLEMRRHGASEARIAAAVRLDPAVVAMLIRDLMTRLLVDAAQRLRDHQLGVVERAFLPAWRDDVYLRPFDNLAAARRFLALSNRRVAINGLALPYDLAARPDAGTSPPLIGLPALKQRRSRSTPAVPDQADPSPTLTERNSA